MSLSKTNRSVKGAGEAVVKIAVRWMREGVELNGIKKQKSPGSDHRQRTGCRSAGRAIVGLFRTASPGR